jgi:hypothetical protein
VVFLIFLHVTFIFLLLSFLGIGPKLDDYPKPKQTDIRLESIDKLLQNINNSINNFSKQGEVNSHPKTNLDDNPPTANSNAGKPE